MPVKRFPLLFQNFCCTIFPMEKRGRGRPPKSPEDRLADRLDVRADPADKSQFERAAEQAGMKLSDWIRDRLKTAASKELK